MIKKHTLFDLIEQQQLTIDTLTKSSQILTAHLARVLEEVGSNEKQVLLVNQRIDNDRLMAELNKEQKSDD